MWRIAVISLLVLFGNFDRAESQSVRGAFPSPSIQSFVNEAMVELGQK